MWPDQSLVSVHPSAQCIPHAGQTHSVWCRSSVQPHVTNRSDGRPGPFVVQRWPAGHAAGGTRTQPRGVCCHFDQSTTRTIEQVYEWRGMPGIATMGDMTPGGMDEDDVRRLALALPDVTERTSWGRPAWFHHHMVARMWDDDRVTVRVEDDGERRALVEQEPDLFQTTDHHAGTAYLLVRLAAADEETLRAVLAESWWWAAPPSWRRTRPEMGPPAPS
ncbi:hypothetical protein Cch01nite_44170 [Cellulomonas chitinilytica]|uniref:MmcQ/YjbR family DNA-binding protein n=1 Tax=Cellulomonas chitinilytica TaxID=398759 RepID=A0A919U1Y5_9CELL|nr:hypothetical protein Cch01nite_44170 [Cellulomonas chitinilytica]